MDPFLALRAIRRFDRIRKRREKKVTQTKIAIADSPFEHEKGPCKASKYETKYLASISLINSVKHASPLLSLSFSFSLFVFFSVSLSLWSCYLHIYRVRWLRHRKYIDDWFSKRRGMEKKNEKKEGIKKRLLVSTFFAAECYFTVLWGARARRLSAFA